MQQTLTLAEWLRERRREYHLSLRQAAVRANVSHVTIAEIENGRRPSIETLQKLAAAFSGDGHNEKAATEDLLLALSGYRSYRAEVQLSEPLARLMDKVNEFNPEQLELMKRLADLITKYR